MIIRRAVRADWPHIIKLHARAARHERRLAGIASFAEIADVEHEFRGELQVAVAHGAVLGFVSWAGNEIAWLYVDPAHFRKGIGTLLLRHALSHTGPVAHIRVLEGNQPMLALCARNGFVEADAGASPPDLREGPASLRLRHLAEIRTGPSPSAATMRPVARA